MVGHAHKATDWATLANLVADGLITMAILRQHVTRGMLHEANLAMNVVPRFMCWHIFACAVVLEELTTDHVVTDLLRVKVWLHIFPAIVHVTEMKDV